MWTFEHVDTQDIVADKAEEKEQEDSEGEKEEMVKDEEEEKDKEDKREREKMETEEEIFEAEWMKESCKLLADMT